MQFDIKKPTLIVDINIAQRNIAHMSAKCNSNQLIFRPHFKTHQSAEIAKIYKNYNINCCTVSSVTMAKYFAKNGWSDITIAFPINLLELEEVQKLASEIQLNILVESFEAVEKVNDGLQNSVGAFIKIDAGYGRTGIKINNYSEVKELIHCINDSPKIIFKGLLIHDGHTYQSTSKAQIEKIHTTTSGLIKDLKFILIAELKNAILSFGDTPSCSVLDSFQGFDEMRPGNFVFYDLMQWRIGACRLEDIAICVACPIVAIHPDRKVFILYGGGIHFSKDRIYMEGKDIFGKLVLLNKHGWEIPNYPDCYIISLSQEHGTLQVPNEIFDQFKVGDVVGILPVHACLTANQFSEYRLTTGEVISRMTVFD